VVIPSAVNIRFGRKFDLIGSGEGRAVGLQPGTNVPEAADHELIGAALGTGIYPIPAELETGVDGIA